ncbi:MAG TPA: SpoIVB peptidase S55 domain-containing protein, partial [Candidatus Hypogeohydataceae bacterium YC40]
MTLGATLAFGAYDTGGVLLNVDELKPGMKGYGKTVFSGEKIEEFDVEILGVLKNWETKNDMILVKLSGGPLEKTGVISGMSGSPVYVEDKVIGAVSYGWGFAKEAIAGVTPIREMLKVLEAGEKEGKILGDARSPLELFASSRSGLLPPSWELPLEQQEVNAREALAREGLGKQSALRMVPIKTPLVVAGFDQRVL